MHTRVELEQTAHTDPALPLWDTFVDHVSEFSFPADQLEQLARDVHTSFRAVKLLNRGEQIPGIDTDILPNTLRYHNWEHTEQVVAKTMQILPGFLKDLESQGVDIKTQLPHVKGILVASIFHEIGYLKRRADEGTYKTQGELYFDHVNRGITSTKDLLTKLHIGLTDQDMVFIGQMIRATDFNTPWPVKEQEEGMTGTIKQWGKVLEAADFLSAFAHPDNIPALVSGLYWENLSRVVQNGKVKAFARNGDGSLVLDHEGRPVLTDVADGQDGRDTYTTIQEVKFGNPVDIREPYEVKAQTLYEFVASEFIIKFQKQMEPYLAYTDMWFGGRSANEIRKNYRVNRERILLLHKAIDTPKTDPFSIFEGGFTGRDLCVWVDALKRQGLLSPTFSLRGKHFHDIDRRVLGTDSENTALSRLVTGELQEILSSTSGDKSLAISILLERFREKMNGENIRDVFLSVAPGAYVKEEGGPFESVEESYRAFSDAFGSLPERGGLPDLHMVWTVRRNRDFDQNGERIPSLMKETANTITRAFTDKKIEGIAFLGVEHEYLSQFARFFETLGHDIPMTIIVGQTFPEQDEGLYERKDRFIKNMQFIAKTLSPAFPRLALWGLHDNVLLTEEELETLKDILPAHLKLMITLTYDRLTRLAPDFRHHPIDRLVSGKPGAAVSIATGNGAYAGFSSVVLDMLSRLSSSHASESAIIDLLEHNRGVYTP
ncbi:hypothetical protein A2973_02360 [Candidatus Gottesmanbacteria bacterium RIFCSPLOWO2_01_FULL_49_10]|uniref:Uncharacterized protein n=1 Tax=Candidatus Gottesmanbacteria bacterium RIFCSPLOWO2_01_FULL_49_10 TaxID=1798396 RepID=A0A1F6AXD8_9BACT|nr:MAG: hypothetical protein A2973_02360 [Candidatus Gottesmanbacteria bacterium RIFCSPLOWO2_01_FULL_49_10]